MVWIGEPGLFIPDHAEVHISCTFTWDMDYCEYLLGQWQAYTDKPVKLGGVAYHSPVGEHIQGMYLKKDIIFTSRGCPNNCSFCIVPKNEGKLVELPIQNGNIIQDNNFLACSKEHQTKVFEMLRTQKGICFKGGLESRLVNEWFACKAKEVRAKELWLACDSDGALTPLENAVKILQAAGFNQNNLYCYVLIGDDIDKNEQRLRAVYNIGAMPFAQLYQPRERKKIEYSNEWKQFARIWSRPAITKAQFK
jgi:hypothetical protein